MVYHLHVIFLVVSLVSLRLLFVFGLLCCCGGLCFFLFGGLVLLVVVRVLWARCARIVSYAC